MDTPDDAGTPPEEPTPGPQQRWYVRWWPLTLAAGLTFGLVAVVAITVGLMYLNDYRTADVPAASEAIQPPTVLLDANGEEIVKLDPSQVGEQVATADLPDHVVDAVLAAEDRGYHDHGGFSVRAIARAAVANLRSEGTAQGASTITQQYIDLSTPGEGRSYRAKLREVATAAKVDGALSKEQILDRYLNMVPFGREAVGIDAAAQIYFRVAAHELDLNQAATLAGMIAAPSAYDPEKNPDKARSRRDTVVRAMAEEGWIEPARADEVTSAELPEVATEPLVDYGPHAYFVDAVRRELEAEIGGEGLGRGLVVHTTMDIRMQELAQETLRSHVGEQPYTGSVVTVDPASGEVRALVGGTDFESESFNAAVQAQRQPGSAFKPLTLAGFIEAGYTPDASRFEGPASLDVETATDTVEVHNFEDQAYGEVTVRDATQNSVNTVYMQMIDKVGPAAVVDLAHRMGITSDVPEVPSIALGTASVTPLEMASGYTAFAAEGIHRAPTLIRSVEEAADGDVVFEHEPEENQAMSPQTAGLVTDVLTDVVEGGTGTAAQIGRPVAGKTGTTDDGRDAWFVGYSPQLVTAVWVGNADNSPMSDATGGRLAAPIWAEYMAAVLEPLPAGELATADDDGLEALDETRPDPPPPPPSPSPSPTETETKTEEPSPTETKTKDPEPTETETKDPEPTETPTGTEDPEPTPTETEEPAPTETDTSGE